MTFLLLLLTFIWSPFLEAKVLEPVVDLRVESCLREILANPIINELKPDLLDKNGSLSNYLFLKETEKYCQCSSLSRKEELDLAEKDPISYAFFDLKERYEKEDQCALVNFSEENIQTFFQVALLVKMRFHLQGLLSYRKIAGVEYVASEHAINHRDECIEFQILQSCSKIKSLRATYTCIKKVTTNYQDFAELTGSCPTYGRPIEVGTFTPDV